MRPAAASAWGRGMAAAQRGATRVVCVAPRLGTPRAGGSVSGSTSRRAPSPRSVARPCTRAIERPCAPRRTAGACEAPRRNARATSDGGEERAAAPAALVWRPGGAAPAASCAVARVGRLGGAVAARGAEAREPTWVAEPPRQPRFVCGVELMGGEGGGARSDGAATTHGSVASRARPVGQGLLELVGEHCGVDERGASARLHVESAAAPDPPPADARVGPLGGAVAGGGAEARERASCAEPPGSSRFVCGVEHVGGEGGGARGGGAATTHGSSTPL